MQDHLDISVVIPVFNEDKNIEELFIRLKDTLDPLERKYEIIFVNDGSTDASQNILEKLRIKNNCLKIIKLRRNFGHHPATYAGFDQAAGEIVVTLDGDLQNPPEEIPKLLNKIKEGWDIVCGWRKFRKEPYLTRRLPSLAVNWLISRKSNNNIHDYGCFLRAYRNHVVKEISKYATYGGWFPVLFNILGFSVAEVEVRDEERAGGEKSHHNFFKRYDQFMSIFSGIATRPFQLIEFIGAFFGMFSVFGVAFIIIAPLIEKVAFNIPVFLLLCCMLLLSILMIFLGLIGEYIVRMNYEIGNKPKYIIDKIV